MANPQQGARGAETNMASRQHHREANPMLVDARPHLILTRCWHVWRQRKAVPAHERIVRLGSDHAPGWVAVAPMIHLCGACIERIDVRPMTPEEIATAWLD